MEEKETEDIIAPINIKDLSDEELDNFLVEKNNELINNSEKIQYEVKNFGDLVEGDLVLGKDGQPVAVSTVYEEHIPEKMYEIMDENGTIINVSGNHLWYVETENNLSLHFNRVKKSRKFLKKILDETTVNKLYEVAMSDEKIETALIDMISAIKSEENQEGINIVTRIARSLGRVSDNNEILEDFETGEKIKTNNIPYYDGKLFCQQILSLYNRKYAKIWPIIKGEVVNTEQLLQFYETANIPVVNSIG